MSNDVFSSTGKAVAASWRRALGDVEISQTSNYFDLGGSSLLMIDMLTQLSTELGIEIDPGLLFQDATLEGFSRSIDSLLLERGSEFLEQGSL